MKFKSFVESMNRYLELNPEYGEYEVVTTVGDLEDVFIVDGYVVTGFIGDGNDRFGYDFYTNKEDVECEDVVLEKVVLI